MSLTKLQEISLFEILEVPYDSTVYKLVDEDNQLALAQIVSDTQKRSNQLIFERLIVIAADPDLEEVLTGLLDRWQELGTKTTTVVDGRVGGTDGINYDPNQERLEIRRQAIVIVPFYRHHDSMSRDNVGIQCIPIVR